MTSQPAPASEVSEREHAVRRLAAFLQHPDWPGVARPLDGPADYDYLRFLSTEAGIPLNIHRLQIDNVTLEAIETVVPLE